MYGGEQKRLRNFSEETPKGSENLGQIEIGGRILLK
jgi:hypothetical protein